ncbi:MAG TPA: type II toxin-antitoxin system RelE/ParE family toxin [Steroidobacteraceae bacterium]|jgi:plasmid stabilization system protein ParE|nr:type II toxin-antitoxin system RelE/ParE family toxin [Steroidobacteraceae bacterium]
MPRCELGLEASHPRAANRRASFVALRWTQSAYGDLRRLYDFLEPVNRGAAVRAVRLIVNRIERIPAQPRLGERLPRFVPREVRRVLAAKYEIRHELTNNDVVVLRIFHAREDR